MNPTEVFITGKLMNVANNREHWRARHEYTRLWRNKVGVSSLRMRFWIPDHPKRVTLAANVWNLYDTHDGLRGALKPVVDGLVDAGVLHSDAPTCGHEFVYAQEINRRMLGVLITVEVL